MLELDAAHALHLGLQLVLLADFHFDAVFELENFVEVVDGVERGFDLGDVRFVGADFDLQTAQFSFLF